jgi:hypothetical protein
MIKVFKSKFFYLILFIVPLIFLLSFKKDVINFIDFPKTVKGELCLGDKLNIDSKKARQLIDNNSLEIKNNLYQITQTQILNQDLKAYELTVSNKDKKNISNGIIIFNKKTNEAIQLYCLSVYLDVLPEDNLSASYLKDINLDGNQEFIIHTYSGGNSLASKQYYIFQITNDGNLKFLNPDISNNSKLHINNILDINFDGKKELVIIDNTWELSGCTDNASSPISHLIYSWKDGVGYVEDSANYQDYYQNIIDEPISKIYSDSKEFYLGPALNKYFAYKIIDREEEGWKKFLELTNGIEDGLWPSKKCLDHIIKLHDLKQEIVPPNNI